MSKIFTYSFSGEFDEILKKLFKKNKALFVRLDKKIFEVIKDPYRGKPLRNIFKNKRRVHVDSFVLVYEINDTEIRFLDFDHHDKVYKKI